MWVMFLSILGVRKHLRRGCSYSYTCSNNNKYRFKPKKQSKVGVLGVVNTPPLYVLKNLNMLNKVFLISRL